MLDFTATSIPRLIIIIKPDFSGGWRGGSAINSTVRAHVTAPESGGSQPSNTHAGAQHLIYQMNESLQSNTFQLIGHKPLLLGLGLTYWCINSILKEKQQIENNKENCTI